MLPHLKAVLQILLFHGKEGPALATTLAPRNGLPQLQLHRSPPRPTPRGKDGLAPAPTLIPRVSPPCSCSRKNQPRLIQAPRLEVTAVRKRPLKPRDGDDEVVQTKLTTLRHVWPEQRVRSTIDA